MFETDITIATTGLKQLLELRAIYRILGRGQPVQFVLPSSLKHSITTAAHEVSIVSQRHMPNLVLSSLGSPPCLRLAF